jgi:hypothetical protein
MTDRLDYDCTQCAGTVWVENTSDDQIVACDSCPAHYSTWYDAEFRQECGHWHGGHILKLLEPPNWRDVEGCLRQHDAL